MKNMTILLSVNKESSLFLNVLRVKKDLTRFLRIEIPYSI